MFRNKSNVEEIKVLPVYPATVINGFQNEIKKNADGIQFTKVKLGRGGLGTVGIDRLAVTLDVKSRNVIYNTEDSDVNSQYMKSFGKGLGRFLVRDWRRQLCLDRYFIMEIGNSRSFVRFVLPDDYRDDAVFTELNHYRLLNLNFGQFGSFRKKFRKLRIDLSGIRDETLLDPSTGEENVWSAERKNVYAVVMRTGNRDAYPADDMQWLSMTEPIEKGMKFDDLLKTSVMSNKERKILNEMRSNDDEPEPKEIAKEEKAVPSKEDFKCEKLF